MSKGQDSPALAASAEGLRDRIQAWIDDWQKEIDKGTHHPADQEWYRDVVGRLKAALAAEGAPQGPAAGLPDPAVDGTWDLRPPASEAPKPRQVRTCIHGRTPEDGCPACEPVEEREEERGWSAEPERDTAESKAWDSLARYKFQMFGYWAAIWVHVNRMCDQPRANPFTSLVKHARESRHA